MDSNKEFQKGVEIKSNPPNPPFSKGGIGVGCEMFKRVRYLFVKELIQVLRDKRMRVTLVFPPIFQLIVFGYAANLDVKNIRTALRDLDQTVESREVMDRFRSSKYFRVDAYPQTRKEIEDLIIQGDVVLSIEIPSGFSRKVKKGSTGTIQIVVDGTESNTALIALGYVGQILSDYSTALIIRKLNQAGEIFRRQLPSKPRQFDCSVIAPLLDK